MKTREATIRNFVRKRKKTKRKPRMGPASALLRPGSC